MRVGEQRPVPWIRSAAPFLVEGVVVTLLLVLLGFLYLRPASAELLRGNAAVMVGDGTDSLTNPWQYRLVVDAAKNRPSDLLFAALYSDQMNAPQGAPSLVPMVERFFVLLYAPFMSPDLMPTAVVWGFMVLGGAAAHAYGRALGWPRAVAFALAVAWAFCPFTRARAVVHIALVTTYWVPMLMLGLHVLARPPPWLSSRIATALAASLFLGVFFSGQYFVVMAAVFAPLFLLYYLLVLPRSASRGRAVGRLALAVLPAVLFGAFCLLKPLPADAARAMGPGAASTASENAYMLKIGGAHASDYVLGDVKLGDRDLNPLRSRLTDRTRAEVATNRHERTNGIRWSVLACFAVLGGALCLPRFRRQLSRDERVLGGFAFALALAAFLFSLSPQAIHVGGVDLGPIQLVAKVLPRFRVPNRIGVLVHFAALLGAGVLLARVLRTRLATRAPASYALGAALTLVMVLDYAPLEAMPLAAIAPARKDLEAGGPNGVCGSGMTVPYVTWGFRDEEYYEVLNELRGTSCKILHTAYLTEDDQTMRLMVGEPMFNQNDRMRAVWLARCTNAAWILFRLNVTDEHRQDFCKDVGGSLTAPDVCRMPLVDGHQPAPVKPLGQCIAETHIVVPEILLPLPR